MLSRVADSLYWMSRYLERAEHTARLLDVNLHQMLDQTPESAEQRWERVATSLRVALPAENLRDAYRVTESLAVDQSCSFSIVSSIAGARYNARQVWEQISTEMWEQINRLYLSLNPIAMEHLWHTGPHEFFSHVKEGIHLLQGITDATMSHGEGWHFIQVGRYTERATQTATLLDVHFDGVRITDNTDEATDDYLEWVGLLKSCTAFEAYAKVHTASIKPDLIAAFLLFDAEFPRSVRFAASRIQTSLQAIAHIAGVRSGGRPERAAGRLRSALEYGNIDDILADDLHNQLTFIQEQCEQIHAAIYQSYIDYPVGAALAAQRQAG
ncbi:MAG: alpha-E domain-containing protein [Chloroflexota bacterium]|nr:alpha-E domain-containing protein [Chloroflexota bacterium]